MTKKIIMLEKLTGDILKAIPIGIVLSFLIGPVFFVLLETSATKGGRSALVLDLGVILADVIFLLIAWFSSYQLLNQLTHHPALYIFGGMIMAFYGLITIIKKPKPESLENQTELELPKNNYLALFAKGFLLNFINIGVLVFWLAMIIIFAPGLKMNPIRIAVFFCTIILSYLSVDVIKILLAKKLKRNLTPGKVVKIKKFIGVILMIAGLYLIFEGVTQKNKLQDTIQTFERFK